MSIGQHTWYVCPPGCEKPACWFCEGGLSACTACGGLEGSLPTHCPGDSVDVFTLNKVYGGEIDFVNGTWVRPTDIFTRWRGQPSEWIRADWDRIEALSSMEKAKEKRGWAA